MLVLMRKEGEAIMVGDNIKIVLAEVLQGKARIAIEAPRDTPVHRLEVYEAIQRNEVTPAPQ